MIPPTTIRVTEQHIIHGERENCEKCPIALALLQAVSDPQAWVEVNEQTIDVHFPGHNYTADTPPGAAAFIVTFDDENDEDKGVRPFEFTVDWRRWDWDGDQS